jgi:hypothetical protein
VAPISLKWRGREFEIPLVGSLIGEIIPEYYDAIGRKTFRPDLRRRSGFRSTFPPGRYLSQPLNTWCSDFADLRSFLSKCKYVSDKEQFGEEDYWQPPDKFEELKKGDCEDFALWTWRQLIHMNYPARFVMGTASRYGDGHAWITFEKDGKAFLLEHWVRPWDFDSPDSLLFAINRNFRWHGMVKTSRTTPMPIGNSTLLPCVSGF